MNWKLHLFQGIILCSVAAFAGNLEFKPDQLEACYKARVTRESEGIRVVTDTPEWDSGLRINPPKNQKFDFSSARYFAVDVENLSKERQLRLTMHLSSGVRGSAGKSHVDDLPHREVNTGIGLNPGEKRTMRIYLPHAFLFTAPDGGKNFRKPLDSSKINSIEFKMQWPFEAGFQNLLNCRLSNFRLEGVPDKERKVNKENYFPFIDIYGQYRHSNWPEKIHSDSDLRKEHARELAELKKTPRPFSWNEFGGWENGPTRKATGSFRVEKYQGKWFFVDPKGKLFWSLGIDVLRDSSDAVNGKKHEHWFESKVPENGILDFNQSNLVKKYGKKDYGKDYHKVLLNRLHAWGINTIGNWASKPFLESSNMPYTVSLGELVKGVPRLGKYKFYDVFHPDFETIMGNLLQHRVQTDPMIKRSLTDPMCIGYFIDNELRFGDIPKAVLSGDPNQASKKEFLAGLKKKYSSVEKLNAAWESKFQDWNAVAVNQKHLKSESFRKDLQHFSQRVVQRYFEICRKGIKNMAPDRLYLGCRFVGFRQAGFIWEAAAKYCDVVSVNTYSNSLFNTNRGDFRDKPILVGEFHYGTYDRGMFSPSLCPVGDQKERATSFTRFVQGALAHPNFVGAHYFQFRDQPLTGRYDGEGYQIGFVDVADTPYPELTKASRNVGENMYEYRIHGKLKNEMK